MLVEREATGGQAGQSSRIENYLGFPDGVSGGQLADRARRQAGEVRRRDAADPRRASRWRRTAPSGCCGSPTAAAIAAHAVVLATGVSYRSLGVAGADGLTGRGVYYGSAMTEAAECADQKVFIVGGANSAGQAAVFFARYASSVHVLVRGPSLEASMSHYLIEQLAGIDNVHVHTCTTVAEAHGTDHLEQLTLQDAQHRGAADRTRPATCSSSSAARRAPTGWTARWSATTGGSSPPAPSLLEDGRRPPGWPLDRDPYFLESSLPGVFVAGDVRADSVKRVASAVGEGAMAVTLVHRYLEER